MGILYASFHTKDRIVVWCFYTPRFLSFGKNVGSGYKQSGIAHITVYPLFGVNEPYTKQWYTVLQRRVLKVSVNYTFTWNMLNTAELRNVPWQSAQFLIRMLSLRDKVDAKFINFHLSPESNLRAWYLSVIYLLLSLSFSVSLSLSLSLFSLSSFPLTLPSLCVFHSNRWPEPQTVGRAREGRETGDADCKT